MLAPSIFKSGSITFQYNIWKRTKHCHKRKETSISLPITSTGDPKLCFIGITTVQYDVLTTLFISLKFYHRMSWHEAVFITICFKKWISYWIEIQFFQNISSHALETKDLHRKIHLRPPGGPDNIIPINWRWKHLVILLHEKTLVYVTPRLVNKTRNKLRNSRKERLFSSNLAFFFNYVDVVQPFDRPCTNNTRNNHT